LEKPTEGAFRSLLRASGLLRHVMEPYFLRFGISGAQWGVLRVLRRAEGEGLRSLRLTDLSGRLLIRPPSVTGVVDRLQRLGLVTRDAAHDDLRAKQVRLTSAGRKLVEHVLTGHAVRIETVMDGLNLVEQEQLQRLLEKLNLRLQALARPGPALDEAGSHGGNHKMETGKRSRT
jgi:DNA-binding MarR family transcriptional regulator